MFRNEINQQTDTYGKSITNQKAVRQGQNLGHGSRRRRCDRTGRRGGRSHARHERSLPGEDRLCEMYVEPFDQTRARRRALPAKGRRDAGARSVARARPHEGQRPAPGEGPGVRHLELPLLGQLPLLLRPDLLRPAFVRLRLRTFEVHLRQEGDEIHPHFGRKGTEGRRGLPRRSVRRLAHGHQPRPDLLRERRHGRQRGHRDGHPAQ